MQFMITLPKKCEECGNYKDYNKTDCSWHFKHYKTVEKGEVTYKILWGVCKYNKNKNVFSKEPGGEL